MFNRYLFYRMLQFLKKALIIATIAILFCLSFWWFILPHGWTDLGNVLALVGVILLFLGTSIPTGVVMTSEQNRSSSQLTHHYQPFYKTGETSLEEAGKLTLGQSGKIGLEGKKVRGVGFFGVTQVIIAGLILVLLGVATYFVPR